MVCQLFSFENYGVSAKLIKIEIDIQRGLPAMHIVGLADRALQEAQLRVAAAIKNSGYKMPMQKIVVNLSPAYIYKSGTSYDLAIALGILIASRQIIPSGKYSDLSDKIFWSELSLNGKTEQCVGALPVSVAAKANGIKEIYLSKINAKEAVNVAGINVFNVASLKEVVRIVTGKATAKSSIHEKFTNSLKQLIDFKDIKGQEFAKRALEIAAAGGHNILLVGSAGIGKTVLGKAFLGILPKLNNEESFEVAQVYSATGNYYSEWFSKIRPFQNPHHTTSIAAMVGGDVKMRPGIIAQAHRGVLFLDECNLFNSRVLEVLREPLEEKCLRVTKHGKFYQYDTDFQLLATMNPCYCGNYGSENKICSCTMAQIQQYKRKLPLPLLNRIDLQVTVSSNQGFIGSKYQKVETSKDIFKRVEKARATQMARGKLNSELTLQDLERLALLNADALNIMNRAIEKLSLSERAQIRMWRVARTIADLAQEKEINAKHLAEAVCYRLEKVI